MELADLWDDPDNKQVSALGVEMSQTTSGGSFIGVGSDLILVGSDNWPKLEAGC